MSIILLHHLLSFQENIKKDIEFYEKKTGIQWYTIEINELRKLNNEFSSIYIIIVPQ